MMCRTHLVQARREKKNTSQLCMMRERFGNQYGHRGESRLKERKEIHLKRRRLKRCGALSVNLSLPLDTINLKQINCWLFGDALHRGEADSSL